MDLIWARRRTLWSFKPLITPYSSGFSTRPAPGGVSRRPASLEENNSFFYFTIALSIVIQYQYVWLL